MSKSFEKMSQNELKGLLKEAGMSQSGDKGTLVFRLGLYNTCRDLNLTVLDGKNPCQLKLSELKTAVAKNGCSLIGNQDEMLTELVGKLKSKKPMESAPVSSSASKGESSGDSSSGSGGIDAVAIARKVLELDELDDWAAILSLGSTGMEKISRLSPTNVMRKAYLKLSLVIHPDKLSRSFDGATKAFQALVRAFDRLSAPEVLAEVESKGAEKAKAISRSNENCFRTRVCCPRCKQPWSENTLDGNPDYFYNFLMMGLKSYTCSTCKKNLILSLNLTNQI